MPFYKDADKRNKPKTNYANKGSWDDEGAHYSDAKKREPGAGSRRFGPNASSDRPAYQGKREGYQGRADKPAYANGPREGYQGRTDRPAYQGKPREGFQGRGDRPASQNGPREGYQGRTDRPAYQGKPREGFQGRSDRPAFQNGPREGYQGRTDRPAYQGKPRDGYQGPIDRPRPSRPYADKTYGVKSQEVTPARKSYEQFEYVQQQPEQEVVANENLLAGRNPIREALKSGRDIEKMLVAKGELSGSAKEIVMMAKEQKIPVQEVDRQRLDEITRNHQGMLAFASAYAYSTVEEMLEVAKERNEDPFLIILDGITDPHNLGAIIRTAECVGAHGVIVPQRRSVGLTPAAVKASAGAIEHLKVARVTNLTRTIEALREAGLWFYAADMEGDAYDKVDFKGGVALVIGAEGEGISRLVLETCDKRVKLPMKGKIDSLNASVAAGVLMYQVMSSRAK